MTDLEVIAYCPFPSYDARHAYLTTAPNRQGATWHCQQHQPTREIMRLSARWLEHLYLGDLIHAIETSEPKEHIIALAKAYDAQRLKHG